MDTDRFATRTSARLDPHGDPAFRRVNTALRAEALRQLRWQQREWERLLAPHAPGTLPLIAFADPTGFTQGLDLLREAGEDVPSWLYRRGARERATEGASGTTRVSLARLVADLTQVLAWFDPQPSAWDQGVSTERPWPGADAASARTQTAATATTNTTAAAGPEAHPDIANGATVPQAHRGAAIGLDHVPQRKVDSGVHHPDPPFLRAYQAGSARSEGSSRPVGHDALAVTWKPTDAGHDAAAGDWTIGDRVTARATAITVRAGSCGTVVGFSGVGGHPLVDVDGSGRVLIRADQLRAEHWEGDDDAPAEARSPGRPRASGTTRLSATPRPPMVVATLPPPPPDWFDRQPPPLW